MSGSSLYQEIGKVEEVGNGRLKRFLFCLFFENGGG